MLNATYSLAAPTLATQIEALQRLQALLKGLQASGLGAAKIVLSRKRSALAPDLFGDRKIVWWPLADYQTALQAWKEIQQAKLLFIPFPLTPKYSTRTLLDDLDLGSGNYMQAAALTYIDGAPSVSAALRMTNDFAARVVPVTWGDRARGLAKTAAIIGAVGGGLYLAHKQGWIQQGHDYLQAKLNGAQLGDDRLSSQELRRLLKKAPFEIAVEIAREGWSISKTSGNHIKWIHPSGAIVFSSSTPSDHRAWKNHLQLLRKRARTR